MKRDVRNAGIEGNWGAGGGGFGGGGAYDRREWRQLVQKATRKQ